MEGNDIQPIRLGTGSSIYGRVEFGNSVVLGDNVVIGYPKEMRIKQQQSRAANDGPKAVLELARNVEPTSIGDNVRIGPNVTIYEGCHIEHDVSIVDRARIGYDCTVGAYTRLEHLAFICDRVSVGRSCTIAGFIGDASRVGDNVTVMGALVHEFSQPHLQWEVDEPAPVIEDRVFVGFHAVVVGGIRIGQNSYIAAGAIVTKDVPPRSVVVRTNEIVPSSEWKGKKLSPEFWSWKT